MRSEQVQPPSFTSSRPQSLTELWGPSRQLRAVGTRWLAGLRLLGLLLASLNCAASSPPSILQQPSNQTVYLGADAMLKVTVAGDGPFGYEWRQNGRTIVGLGAGAPSLVLSNVQAASAGAYTVLITNAAAPTGVLSTRAILTVLPSPVGISSIGLLQEGCLAPNGAVDPEEVVTVAVSIVNTNSTKPISLVAKLLEGDGVMSTSQAVTFPNISKGGAAVTQSFSFQAQGQCGSPLVLRFQLSEGTTQLGIVKYVLRLGDDAGHCCGQELPVDLQVIAGLGQPSYLHLPAELSYDFSISNAGPHSVSSVSITNYLSPFAALVSAEATRGDWEQYANQLVCRIGSVAAGEVVRVSIAAHPLTTGLMTNRVEVHGALADPNTLNNSWVVVREVRGEGITIDFDALDTANGPASYEKVAQYLASAGVLLSAETPSTTLVGTRPMEPGAASSLPNVLVADTLNPDGVVRFTLRFRNILRSLEFTRTKLGPQDDPAFGKLDSWEVKVFDALGLQIDSFEESICDVDCAAGTTARRIRLQTPGARSATFSARGNRPRLPLDDLILLYSPSNVVPRIVLTSPSGGTPFRSGSPILLSAQAGDLDDTITRVSFYDGPQLLTTLTDPPYRWNWVDPPRGYHTIKAVVTDARGAVGSSGEARITVDLAVITSEPIDQRVRLGQSVRFTVTAEDAGPLTYQWYRNNLPIAGSTQPSLAIDHVQAEDGGDCAVVVDNRLGLARSRVARLELLDVASALGDIRATPRSDFWMTDGPVHAIYETNGVVYVRGAFGQAVKNSGSAGAFDISDGSEVAGFPNLAGDVRAVISDRSGGFFVAGYFSVAGHLSGTNLVRIRQDGSLDPNWFHAVEGPIFDLALSEEMLFVGGFGLRVDGQGSGNLAAFDLATGRLTAWSNKISPVPPSTDGWAVTAPATITPLAFVGSPPLPLSPDGGGNSILDLTYNPRPDYWDDSFDIFTADGVQVMGIEDGTLYLGGFFTELGSETRMGLGALDVKSGKVLPWRADLPGNLFPFPGVTAIVTDLLAVGGRVYVCGGLDPSRGGSGRTLIALDGKTGAELPFHPAIEGSVEALGVGCNSLIIGGRFTKVGGKPRGNLAALDLVTGQVRDWDPQVDGRVNKLTTLFNTVYVTGDFTKVGESSHGGFAAVDLTTGLAKTLNVPPGGRSFAIAADPKKLWLARAASTLGISRPGYAAFEVRTGLPLDVSPPPEVLSILQNSSEPIVACQVPADMDLGNLYKKTINVSAVSGDIVYSGGRFSSLAGSAFSRRNLAAVHCGEGVEILPWNPGADGEVTAIHLGQEHLYVGGLFRKTGGRIQPNFAVFPRLGAPQIIAPPRGGVVVTNGSFGMSVEASGTGTFRFQWFFNGTNLVGATNRSLTIDSARLAEAGAYSVLVSSALGSVLSPEARLVVVEPVHIKTQPASITATPGANLLLRVEATSVPPPLYQWRINGVNIPGADQPTYVIPNAHPTNGGTYTVVVANPGGAVRSDPALVIIDSPTIPFSDSFAGRVALSDRTRLGSGTSTNASREVNEPNHVQKMGGRSVWLSWVAPTNGVATFSTRGSTFDTLLSIYTGTNFSDLTVVAEDEDRGEFATSLTAINARAGVEYLVAVDGFAGDSGHVVLSWDLDSNTVEFPKILDEPLNQSVVAGSEVTFKVRVADSPTPVGYQWLYNCTEMAGETSPVLRLRNVRLDQVGLYSVRVTNASTKVVESSRAILEIGQQSEVVAQDKFEDLFKIGDLTGPVIGGQPGLQEVSPPSAGTIVIQSASAGSQTFANFGAKSQAREPNHCGIIGGASKWLRMRSKVNGKVAVHTMGSTLDTVIGVYQLIDLHNIREIACDNDSGSDGVRSLARFNVIAEQDYYIAVDAVGGVEGVISLHWLMGTEAVASTPFSVSSARVGSPLVLRVASTNSIDAPLYQWRLKDQMIKGATNALLSIERLNLSSAGVYSVVLSNLFGLTTNVAASVTVTPPALQIAPPDDTGRVRLSLVDPSSEWYSIQQTEDLIRWQEYQRFLPTNRVVEFEIEASGALPQFYRVVPAQ